MKFNFDITTKEFLIVKTILEETIFFPCQVFIFGSRAKNKAQDYSDLDLALHTKEKIDAKISTQLKNAFEESLLPYTVDIVDINAISTSFKAIVDTHKKLFLSIENKLVPKLRFEEFAGDWKYTSLGDTSEIIGGGTPETVKPEYWGGIIQWFTPSELKQKYISKSKRTITDIGLKKSSAKILPKGTLLFSSRATVGEVAISLNECCTNQGFQSFVVNSLNNTEFLYNWIIENKNQFIKRSSGSTFLEISKKEIVKIKLNLPPLPEQQKIASFLSALDEKLQQLTKKKELLAAYKKGLMQQLFSQELRFKDDNGKNYPDWEEKKLGEIIKSYSNKNNDMLYPAVAIGKYGIRKREDIYSISLSNDISRNKVIHKNTLTIGMGSKQIDIGILLEDIYYCVSPAYNTYKISSNINSCFLQELLKEINPLLSVRYMIISARQGKSVDKDGFLSHKLNLPILKEQKKIANFLSSLDKKIELISTQIENTKVFKKGLLQQMFI